LFANCLIDVTRAIVGAPRDQHDSAERPNSTRSKMDRYKRFCCHRRREIRTRGTASIDRETIRLSNKKNPKLLFIPTASSDSERYWKRVQEYFGKFLKCRTDILLLIKEEPSTEQIRKKTLLADIIYVGGGNTLQMMRVWRRLGVDKLIKSAYENGTVLSGISAGSICWFHSGHFDAMPFYNNGESTTRCKPWARKNSSRWRRPINRKPRPTSSMMPC
jgi:peptidase S51-like protein